MFGVITTENIEQAIARAEARLNNDCALSAIEMVNLVDHLEAAHEKRTKTSPCLVVTVGR